MLKDLPEGTTNYCTHKNNNPSGICDKCLPKKETEILRRDFQEFADSIVWSNNDGSEKYIGVGNMFDWWVDKIEKKDKKLIKKIKCLIKNRNGGKKYFGTEPYSDKGYNEALLDVIRLLK